MKLGRNIFIVVFACFTFLAPITFFADELTQNIQSQILETFDPDTRVREWVVRSDERSSEDGFPRTIYTGSSYPEAVFGDNPEGLTLEVLGVNSRFTRPGYNYVEIVPVDETGADSPIPIEGRAKQFDVWVWGANYNFSLDIQLRDYQGMIWTLPLGNLNYTGWRNLSTIIPSYIPQSDSHQPLLRTLSFVKFIMWTQPGEDVSNHYLYIDQLKILSDMFETRFDGLQLADPETVDEVWGEEPQP